MYLHRTGMLPYDEVGIKKFPDACHGHYIIKSTEDSRMSYLNALPSPALSGSGSEGMISALILRHPYWLKANI